MVRLGLVVQVANTGDVRSVTLGSRPMNRCFLGYKRCQRVIGLVLHDVIIDRSSFRFTLRPWLHEHGRHRASSSLKSNLEKSLAAKVMFRLEQNVPRAIGRYVIAPAVLLVGSQNRKKDARLTAP